MRLKNAKARSSLVCALLAAWAIVCLPFEACTQALPWVVFEFESNAGTQDQKQLGKAINGTIKSAVESEQVKFASLTAVALEDRDSFVVDHSVQFFVAGKITFVGAGMWVEAALKRTSAAPTDSLWSEGELNLEVLILDSQQSSPDMHKKVRDWLQDALLFAIRTVRESTNRQRILAFCIVPDGADLQDEAGAITAAFPSQLAGLMGTSRYVGGLQGEQISRVCSAPKQFLLKSLYHHIVEGLLTAGGQTIVVLWDGRRSSDVAVQPSKVDESARALAEEAAKRASNP